MNDIVKTISNIGIIYFIVFSIVYAINVFRAFLLLVKYFNTDFAESLMAKALVESYAIGTIPGTTMFKITAAIAIGAWILWLYQSLWRDRTATVS
jgi:hypothetical protein